MTRELYDKLSKKVEEAARIEPYRKWYEVSYPLFIDAPLDSFDDLYRVIAYTYSWMPRIPEVYPDKLDSLEALMENIETLKLGDLSVRTELFELIVPVVNNSLVGASKVIHFIAPQVTPIIDSRVCNSWNEHLIDESGFSLPREKAMNLRHLKKYILYWDYLVDWADNLEGLEMRDIEKVLYLIGGNGNKKAK